VRLILRNNNYMSDVIREELIQAYREYTEHVRYIRGKKLRVAGDAEQRLDLFMSWLISGSNAYLG
jgi:hypothetical protein